MIIVTGGAGFIGSNLIRSLNNIGYSNILIVDNKETILKSKNIKKIEFSNCIDKDLFHIEKYNKHKITAIFHNGACTDTTNSDVGYFLNNNFQYSKYLLDYALREKIPFIYASSASIYGRGLHGFREYAHIGDPLNAYAFSKYIFDQYVFRVLKSAKSQIVGLRYFNVFGPNESHKKKCHL